jgi:cellulose biosynthesis protein BcsQ
LTGNVNTIIIAAMIDHPYVLAVSSEKGGVGKTTLATNLAIFLKALAEDLPVSILSFDNHYTVDRMFEIKGQALSGDVAGFLGGVPGADILQTGQYGVNYIPSSRHLGDIKKTIYGTLALARLIAESRIPGILIIDTRPDLDILTQNALFAADRVLIPVKDMASLENCRNIFELFEIKGFDRKSLSLIPCIIDSRIKFNGPFRDQRSLLRAYAINRGYRCMDTYISKSPKVESLGTNPSGKVFPILTHARNTEVYNQFTQLAESVLADFHAEPAPRSRLFHQWLATEEQRQNASYATRREALHPDCLVCGRHLLNGPAGMIGYYFEVSDGSAAGFLEDDCFAGLLLAMLFGTRSDFSPDAPGFRLLKEAAAGSSFSFRTAESGSGMMIEFSRFDANGNLLLRKHYPLKEYAGGILKRERSGLYPLMMKTVAGRSEPLSGTFLLVHPVTSEEPERILRDEQYRTFSRLKERIAEQLEGSGPL